MNVREVLNAIFYVLWTGCQWKALPKDLPPRSTVWEYLDLWEWDGTLNRIHHALYVEAREQAGREASPTTAIIDSQSAKGALKGALSRNRSASQGPGCWVRSGRSGRVLPRLHRLDRKVRSVPRETRWRLTVEGVVNRGMDREKALGEPPT